MGLDDQRHYCSGRSLLNGFNIDKCRRRLEQEVLSIQWLIHQAPTVIRFPDACQRPALSTMHSTSISVGVYEAAPLVSCPLIDWRRPEGDELQQGAAPLTTRKLPVEVAREVNVTGDECECLLPRR